MGDGSTQILLWADFPALTFPSPAREPGSGEKPGQGSTGSSLRSSAWYDRVGSSLRTCLLSELGGLTRCSLLWKPVGTPSGRPWWVLSMSEPRTGGTRSSSSDGTLGLFAGSPRSEGAGGAGGALPLTWSTPRRTANVTSQKALTLHKSKPSLMQQVQGMLRNPNVSLWPTPTATDYGSNGNAPGEIGPRRPSLRGSVTWPTPTSADGGSTSRGGDRKGGLLLGGMVRNTWPTPCAMDSEQAGGSAAEQPAKHRDRAVWAWPAGPGEPQHEWEPPRLAQLPLGGDVDGVPARLVRAANKHALRCYGNAVCPQVAEVIGRAVRRALTGGVA